MKPITAFFLFVLLFSYSYGQTPAELYNNKDFKSLIKLEPNADKLTPSELGMVGYAFFQVKNDNKAIEFYDKAIARGLNNSLVHFYKGLSLRYLKKYNEALTEINLSLKMDPTNQEYMTEKGMIFYSQSLYDKALNIFEQTTKLPNTFPDVYHWIARIYHEREDYSKALTAYYDAIKYLPEGSSYYLICLRSIGHIEYTVTKDYEKSAKAYSEAITLDNKNYELYYKLIKSYNAEKKYEKADSLFAIVKSAFEKGTLPKEDMEIKTIEVGQFEWNGQIVTIRKSLIEPKETFDISYEVFLLNKEVDNVERRFLVEKTFEIKKAEIKHFLCEQDKKTGHITYPYGWTTDKIPIDDLERVVVLVLDGKMTQGASSNFSNK